ncbi:class I SAM-dependent methyltransferase [Flavobacterium undicola]|uniref:class I SAM-dependent methyltransferase n=1 Tax=Flavobacterium undicola TaxID=1932779 RepID=UPI001376D077|nr:methyltransferase domain-containing protein [Flavobacterium undicola]MBA0884009.1 methyltransferase domain-containing protein [Flavobacterium undicola]
MEAQLEQIREQQKDSWNKFSPDWKKWDTLIMEFLQPIGDEMIKLINPKENETVLDVATGTGQPGISIAAKIGNGKIIFTDLAAGMLEIAEENARKAGIPNFETQVCDVSELPFADNSFDIISCRLGFMFFPDMQMAAKELTRVLKPGGRITTSVWSGPEKNFWVTAIGGTINKNMEIAAPAEGAPGMFRCAKPGFIASIFKEAGLKNISETEVLGTLNCGTDETYWSMMTEIAAPFVAALSKADDAMRAKIKKEVSELINERFPDGNVSIPSSAIVIYGEK